MSQNDLVNVRFKNGQILNTIIGAMGEKEEFYDSNHTGNPLLDTSGDNRKKKLSKNFTVDELARSGKVAFNKARIDPDLVQCLQRIRDYVGKPVTVNSCYRSYKYNLEVIYKDSSDPKTHSRHISGQAADISVKGMSSLELAKVAIKVCGPYIGIGVANSYVHVDIRGEWAAWSYSGTESILQQVKTFRKKVIDTLKSLDSK